MADQGRNADGLGDTAEAVNVVRFPGDWFGPLEDLVPLDAEGDWDRNDIGAEAETSASYADAFWGEGAETVHGVGDPVPRDATVSRAIRTPTRWRSLILVAACAVALLAPIATFLIANRSAQAPRPLVSKQALARPKTAPAVIRTVTAAATDGSDRRRPGALTGSSAKSVASIKTATSSPRTYISAVATTQAAADTETHPSSVTTTPAIRKPGVSRTGTASGDALPDLAQIQQQP